MSSRRALIGRLVGLVLVCLSAGAWAGQSATMECVEFEMINTTRTENCLKYEFRVSISSDADLGRVGAFGIGVQLEDGQLSYWTAANGFGPYRGGLVQPVEGVMRSLPASRSYLVFAGTPGQLCALSGSRSFDVYAGFGSVPPDREAQLEYLLTFKMPISADHIRGAYIQADVHKNPWKIGLVYSWRSEWCNGGNGANVVSSGISSFIRSRN